MIDVSLGSVYPIQRLNRASRTVMLVITLASTGSHGRCKGGGCKGFIAPTKD